MNVYCVFLCNYANIFFERVSLLNILVMMMCICRYMRQIIVLQIENTSESDPHSYEATKAVEL